MINFLGVIVLSLFSLVVNGEPKEKVITVCKHTKSTYVHINTDFSTDKKDQTLFKTEEQATGEAYTLSKLIEINTEEDKLLFLISRYYNISYSSTKFPFFNWNLLDNIRERKDGLKVEILSEGNPLIIRTYFPHIQDQIYFFNLDSQGNGTMTMVSTRWYSPMNAANNQALFYAECKKP